MLPRPQSLSKGGEENEKKNIFPSCIARQLITATDLYRLQLHCTVSNKGPAEEAEVYVYTDCESVTCFEINQ